MTSYCVKCKKKTDNFDEKQVTTKNNKPAIKSVCPNCGTTKYRFISQKGGVNFVRGWAGDKAAYDARVKQALNQQGNGFLSDVVLGRSGSSLIGDLASGATKEMGRELIKTALENKQSIAKILSNYANKT